jgi:hypothetical protein
MGKTLLSQFGSRLTVSRDIIKQEQGREEQVEDDLKPTLSGSQMA